MATAPSKLAVNLVTPKGVVAHESVDAVTAPGELGEFELLPGHVPMLSALKPGVVTLGTKAGSRFAVGAGYLRIDREGNVEILVDQALAAKSVDVAQARKELAAVEAEIEKWGAKPIAGDRHVLELRAGWAHAQIDAASH